MFDLSIVIPTFNRATLLDQCLSSVRNTVACGFEVIVVDGASTDETADVLADASRLMGTSLRVIGETAREGFVRAANKGLRAARGRCVTWLNDDARPMPGCYDQAVKRLDSSPPDAGILALFHRCGASRSVAYRAEHLGLPFQLMHVRGTLYANFGVARRETFDRLGWFDERYYLYAADPDFSLKAWHAGLSVVPARGCFVDHDEHADDRRDADASRGAADNAQLFAKWDLPPKNAARNDFDPMRPNTLRGTCSPLAA